MISEEAFDIATSFHLLLLDVRSVLLSHALLDDEKTETLPRHLNGPYRASLVTSLRTAQRLFGRHHTRYAEAVAIAAQMDQLMTDAMVLFTSSGDPSATVAALRDLFEGERWRSVDSAYRALVNRQARRPA